MAPKKTEVVWLGILRQDEIIRQGIAMFVESGDLKEGVDFRKFGGRMYTVMTSEAFQRILPVMDPTGKLDIATMMERRVEIEGSLANYQTVHEWSRAQGFSRAWGNELVKWGRLDTVDFYGATGNVEFRLVKKGQEYE